MSLYTWVGKEPLAIELRKQSGLEIILNEIRFDEFFQAVEQ